MVRYLRTKRVPQDALLSLYADAGWTAYTRDPEKLSYGVAHSWRVITAWEGEKLPGLVRAISDGRTIAYIQDILVLKAYQGQGIGAELIRRMLAAIGPMRQIALMTDASPENKAICDWYLAQGFQSYEAAGAAGFAIFNP